MIQPKTQGQDVYVKAIRSNTITFCIGLPGTGKTFLACMEAVNQLKQRKVERIIITRPIIEAGEHIGFLPGTLEEKTKPYLLPVIEGLQAFLNGEKEKNQRCIEISPLAYMRGRTFSNSFVILDEAQNATYEQLKMFITRIGNGTKMIITGDLSQSDIGGHGLQTFIDRLDQLANIGIVRLTASDIVRHPIIGAILERLDTPRSDAK